MISPGNTFSKDTGVLKVEGAPPILDMNVTHDISFDNWRWMTTDGVFAYEHIPNI